MTNIYSYISSTNQKVEYNVLTNTATIFFRPGAGLYSALGHRFFVTFVDVIKMNPFVKNILIKDDLNHYFKFGNVDIFEELFIPSIDNNPDVVEAAKKLITKPTWIHHGLYDKITNEHKFLFNLLLSPNINFQNTYNFLLQKYCLNLDTTLAVCIRGTDVRECKTVSNEEWIIKIREYLEQHPIEKILLQTDDIVIQKCVANYFGNKCVTFEENITTDTKQVIHTILKDNEKTNFVKNIDATCRLLANSRYLISHTGNTGCAIMYYRNKIEPNLTTILSKQGIFYTF